MKTDFYFKNTDELSDLYGDWLAANYLPDDEPVDELLHSHADELTAEQREWLNAFRAAYKAQEDRQDAAFAAGKDHICQRVDMISEKWVAKFGVGYHPDTSAEDYNPPLTREEIEEYATDMRYLFAQPCDPYEAGLKAMERAGLIDGTQD